MHRYQFANRNDAINKKHDRNIQESGKIQNFKFFNFN